MIKKIWGFIQFLILIALIGGIAFLGVFIYNEFFKETQEPKTYNINSIFSEDIEVKEKTQTETPSTSIGELVNGSSNIKKYDSNQKNVNNNFFYNQLSDDQKTIYDGLMQNKQYLKQGNYVINYGNTFSKLLSQEGGADTLGDDYQSAIEAFTHDNIDVFYIDVNKMYLSIETTTKFFKTSYNVYISAAKDSNYLSNEFQSTEKIEKALMDIEQEKDIIINNLKGSDYQNIVFIHDYIVDKIDYDSTYNEIGSYNIYGALVRKKCVCEGYAKAFKYLANSAGYECELMQGTATNSSGQSESHAWNCIKINDNWYEVDVTWDDPIIVGGNGRTTNQIKYRFFLKGTRTFEKDHVLEFQFSEKGRKFSYPSISTNDY